MNRGLTGLLAWSALALVIAVPSAEILITRPDATPNVSTVVMGPPVAELAPPTAEDAAATPSLPFQPETGPVRVVMSTKPKSLPLPPIVPAGPPVKTVAEEVVTPPTAPALETAALEAEPAAPQMLVEPAYVGAESLIVPPAPTPMPAPQRPRQASVVRDLGAPETQLQRDVSRSIATVRTTVRNAPVLRGDVLETDNDGFWGDDPQYRGRRNLQTFEDDDASDSAFFELWQTESRPAGFQRRGSFEEQLPVRRGNAVRLDLLQQ